MAPHPVNLKAEPQEQESKERLFPGQGLFAGLALPCPKCLSPSWRQPRAACRGGSYQHEGDHGMSPRSPLGLDAIAAAQDWLTCISSPLHWDFLVAETRMGAQPSCCTKAPARVSGHP